MYYILPSPDPLPLDIALLRRISFTGCSRSTAKSLFDWSSNSRSPSRSIKTSKWDVRNWIHIDFARGVTLVMDYDSICINF